MARLKGVMIQGTSSDAGKSFIVTGLCRVLSDMGCRVTPFKSQNMSNNSYVTFDGKEIGRAQGVQAEAARALPSVYMNPILLKPMMDTKSEVVLLGEVFKPVDGWDYHKKFTMEKGIEVIKESLHRLSEDYEIIVIEGAGSPAEVNLNDREIVNMRIARLANTPVILVTDIDRGGSFASLVGTIQLVGEYKRFIKGVIFNKFRGDITLLQDGLDWFENYTGIPVVGVMPYLEDVAIETEDAQSMQRLGDHKVKEPLDIAVLGMKRVSNNTDVEPFMYEDDVSVRIISNACEFGCPHALIIPGTKSTIDDLAILHKSGIGEAVRRYAENGGIVFGICGGYQMMGQSIYDESGVDSTSMVEVNGLGILPLKTWFEPHKKVCTVSGHIVCKRFKNVPVSGYEIHLGRTETIGHAEYFMYLQDSLDGVVVNNGQIMGCYLHHVFHNDLFRNKWLNMVREKAGLPLREEVDTTQAKERAFTRLAQACRKHLDMGAIIEMMEHPVA